MSLAPEPLQPTDFVLRLVCAHATPASYRVEVQCAERDGTPARPIWRRQYPRPVLAIPSIDTWTLETLRQFIREVDAFLPAHPAADAVAIITLREWKTGSQKLRVTVTATNSRAELSLTNWDHCDSKPLDENGCSGVGEGFSVPILDVLRRVHERPLTVAAFDVPPLHQTVQESEGVPPDSDGDIAVESAIHVLRRLAREDPDIAATVVGIIRNLEGLS